MKHRRINYKQLFKKYPMGYARARYRLLKRRDSIWQIFESHNFSLAASSTWANAEAPPSRYVVASSSARSGSNPS